ncbi:MAG: hypothetical protein VKQ33_03125 [Candidatus Sericytochromatia bacterium]|nr:hypothetical protein [Candidatus Sericytochromatia bacterium]
MSFTALRGAVSRSLPLAGCLTLLGGQPAMAAGGGVGGVYVSGQPVLGDRLFGVSVSTWPRAGQGGGLAFSTDSSILLGGQNRIHMDYTASLGLALPRLGLLQASVNVGATGMMGTALNQQVIMAGRRVTNFGDSYLVANLPVSAWLILPVGAGTGLALMGRYSPQILPWGATNSMSNSHTALGGYLNIGGISLGLVHQVGGLQDGTTVRLGIGG